MAQSSVSIVTHTFPSPYGSWILSTGAPPTDLVDDVESYWESKGHVSFGFEKLAPRGLVDLIFNLGGPQAMYDGVARRSTQMFQRVWISGLFDRPLFVGPAYDAGIMGTHLVGVSIEPWAVYRLFGVPASELTNTVIDAEDLFGAEVQRTWHRLGEAKTTEDRYAALMHFVRQCQRKLARPAPFSAIWAASQTRANFGNVRVQSLCDELSISRKHLASMFKRTVGLAPKAYARLARFRASMDALQSTPTTEFAELALDLGYSDQAHFINEFTRFSGDSPLRFLKAVSADGESVLYGQDG